MESTRSLANDQTIAINVKRYRGSPLRQTAYTISETTLFVWAGIHRGDGKKSSIWDDEGFAKHYFLELHALTQPAADPELICNTDAFRCPEGFETYLPTVVV
jgi:hypothetical protein